VTSFSSWLIKATRARYADVSKALHLSNPIITGSISLPQLQTKVAPLPELVLLRTKASTGARFLDVKSHAPEWDSETKKIIRESFPIIMWQTS